MPNKDKFINWFKKLFEEIPNDEYDFDLGSNTNPIINNFNEEISEIDLPLDKQSISSPEDDVKNIFPSLKDNFDYMKSRYNSMINSDIVFREFVLNARNKQYKALLVYIDGMINTEIMNESILKPLMLKNNANSFAGNQNRVVSEVVTNNVTIRKVKKFDIVDYINSCLLPQNEVSITNEFDKLVSGINSGNCALFIDTLESAFDISVKGFEKRSLNSPTNEVVVKGSQVGFTENLRTNTSLLRRYVNNENLVIEMINIGTLSQTPCAICYLKNVANSDLVYEVKYRMNNIKVDYLLSSGQLEQLIEDDGRFSLPQILSTERPDKASEMLFGGKVVIIVNGTPYVLVAPGVLSDFITSPEDINIKHQYANFVRILRYIALFITILLPGIYLAITSMHQELIPTELLFAIVASRESVPFPIVFEILVMEFSFELIREASIRVPSPIGPTLGIVGALILGQAAVQASIVSPILIIIVSITAISSFTIPDFSLSFHARITRFIYIILGSIAGFLGISVGVVVHFAIICSMNSFGMPYVEPAIFSSPSGKGLILAPPWKRESRLSSLFTKRPKEQERITMKWKYK